MRGPEEAMNSDVQSSSNQEGGSEQSNGRDPCSSPPCKRLKQAVLNFQSNTSTSSSDFSPSSSSSPQNLSNGIASEVIVIHDENRAPNCGGLVTAAPSPPDKGQLKPQTPTAVQVTSTSEEQKDSAKQQDNSDITMSICKQTNDSSMSMDPVEPCSPKQTDTDIAKTPLKPTSAEKKKSKEQMQRMKEEKQKLKEEKEKQRQEARALKEKERLEAKQKKEQERLEKQAEKEKKEKERLEKKQREEKEKLEKREKKEEERRKKEEETNAKLEEKRRKEEEKKQQEEEMKRKKKQASLSFKSFFITKTSTTPPKTLPKTVLKFEPFEIKPHMSLAPVYRKQLSKESQQKLDELMKEQPGITSYMEELQKQKPLPPYRKERRRTIASKPQEQHEPMEISEKKENSDMIEISDDESSDSGSVVEIQPEEKKQMKAIFLKFYENHRPPYYGTQRKKSKKISPRNPLAKDEGLLNYEVDSDDEWEEEEPGESLSDCSDGDEDDQGDDGEDEDDGFFVPHGYLSDDEGIDAEDVDNDVNPTSRQEQQLAKVKAWEAELKKKCKAKRPVCIGCIWPDDRNVNDILQQFEACVLVDEPAIAIDTSLLSTVDSCSQSVTDMAVTPDGMFRSGMYVPEEAMPDLITLIHRSTAGVSKLIDYFKQHWSKKCENTKAHPSLTGKGHISKRQLETKIKAIATKERRNDKARWYVHGNILAAYGLTKLEITENERGTSNGKFISSPPSSSTGIKVFAMPASPSIIKSPSAVPQTRTDQPVMNTSMKDKQVRLETNTQSKVSTGQEFQVQNAKPSSIMPTAKRRVVLQPISKPVSGVDTKENPPNLMPSEGQCSNVVGTNSRCTETLSPVSTEVITKKPEQDNSKPLSGSMDSSLTTTVTNGMNKPDTPSSIIAVVASDSGCVTTAVKRTAQSPVGADRAAKVPRRNEKSEDIIPIPNNINMHISARINASVVETKPVAQDPIVLLQHSKETAQESCTSKTTHLEGPGSETLERISMKNEICLTDGIKPMEIEQAIKA